MLPSGILGRTLLDQESYGNLKFLLNLERSWMGYLDFTNQWPNGPCPMPLPDHRLVPVCDKYLNT